MSGKASGYQKFFQDARKSAAKSMTPEQQVLRHLAEQSNQKRRQKRSKRRPPPIFATVLLLVAAGAGVAGVMFPNAFDEIESIESAVQAMGISNLPKVSFGLFGQASAAEKKDVEKPEPAKADAAKNVADAADPAAAKSPDTPTDVKQWSSEEVSFFKRLNDRKVELDRREAELAKLEEELQKQRLGIEEKIQQLETMRTEISATLKGRVEQDQEKVAKLVDVYSNMKPTSAARVIESLNEDLAMTILDRMKKKNAAEILNTMSGPKAKKLSEMLTGYRQPASADKSAEKTEGEQAGSPSSTK